jgi:hypothetical protein
MIVSPTPSEVDSGSDSAKLWTDVVKGNTSRSKPSQRRKNKRYRRQSKFFFSGKSRH